MQLSKRSSVGVGLIAVAVVTALACERMESPNSPLAGGIPSYKDRATAFTLNQSARVVDIEGRIRTTKGRGLSSDELVQVKKQRATWKWVGVMHHQAMQEAIHDRSIKGLNSVEGRCAARARYGLKYAGLGSHVLADDYKAALVRSVNEKFDPCLTVPAGRIFSLHPVPTTALEDQIRVDTMSAAFVDYTYALANRLGNATSLQDANNVVNAFLVTINNDPSLSPVVRDALSAAAALAASSAAEWDGYYGGGESDADPHEWEMNLFMWGWLSSVGKWVSQVVQGDVYGCGYGMIGVFLVMSEAHIALTLPEFGQSMAYACGAGGIIGSILAAY
jgi:hypothetical protein